jgi:hypothetical protein
MVTYYLSDYPERHNGNIMGLTKKAIKWHREEARKEGLEYLEKYGEETKAKIPPFESPDIDGIRFLATVGDIAEEAMVMENCLLNYIPYAIEGHSYLYHIDYKNEIATVELNESGNVIQAWGPKNTRNQAAKWGARRLAWWEKQLFPPIDFIRIVRGNEVIHEARIPEINI